MRTICVEIKDTRFNYNIIKAIEELFPCFINIKVIDNNYIEVTIECRQEDAGAVERHLSYIV